MPNFLSDEKRHELQVMQENSKWIEVATNRMDDHGLSHKTSRILKRGFRFQEKAHPGELLLSSLGPADDYVDQRVEELKAQGDQVYRLTPSWLAPATFSGIGLTISGLVSMALYLLVGSGSVPLTFLLPTTLAFAGIPFIYNAIQSIQSPGWKKAVGTAWVSVIGALGFVLATVWPATKEGSGLWILGLFVLGAVMVVGSMVGFNVLQSRPRRCTLPKWRAKAREILAEVSLKSSEEITKIVDDACSGLDGRDINDVHGTPEEFAVNYWPSVEERRLHNEKPALQRAMDTPLSEDFNPDDRVAELTAALGPVIAHAMVLWPLVGGRDGFMYGIVGFAVSGLLFFGFYRSGKST